MAAHLSAFAGASGGKLSFGYRLKLESTLLQLLIAAKELSWDLDEENIQEFVRSSTDAVPEPAFELRKFFADYRAVWQGLMAKLSISKSSPASLEAIDLGNIVEEKLQVLLDGSNLEMFKSSVERIDSCLQKLAEAVNIETSLHTHESSSVDKFEMMLVASIKGLTAPNLQIPSNEISNEYRANIRNANLFLKLIKDSEPFFTKNPADLARFLTTKITWGLDDVATRDLVGDATFALKAMKLVVNNIKMPVPQPPNFSNGSVIVHWELSLSAEEPLLEDFPRNSLVNRVLGDVYWSSVPERPFGVYKRVPVRHEDLRPHQRYRGVCKIVMSYHEQLGDQDRRWSCGTGWLIDNQTVITAAHNLYSKSIDRENPTRIKTEHAKDVLVAIGYSGNKTIPADEVEIRRGRSVVIHSGYYAKDPKSHDPWWQKYDIAAIRLEKPFDKADHFKWRKTPLQVDKITIQVVGYPADLPEDEPPAERGSIMYKSQQELTGNLDEGHQIVYVLDTSNGNSGGPVIHISVDSEMEIIGIHCYGDAVAGVNKATPLGYHGNDPDLFRRALDITGSGEDESLVTEEVTLIAGTLTGKRISIPNQLKPLNEAIISMFRWHQKAARCYVYLSDVSVEEPSDLPWERAFRDSRWFTRGWTLQELLAPASVEFFAREGQRLGDKESLEQPIQEITRIATSALRGTDLSQFDVDERFEWAKSRETTREEDWAYCLLGIFGVSMPALYGEGKQNALRRLKREISSGEISSSETSSSLFVLDKLPAADGAAFDSRAEGTAPTCHRDTRVDLLRQIREWADHPADQPQAHAIFWLNGMARTEKSTISRTVARHFADCRRLGASIFFKRGDGDQARGACCITHLAAF